GGVDNGVGNVGRVGGCRRPAHHRVGVNLAVSRYGRPYRLAAGAAHALFLRVVAIGAADRTALHPDVVLAQGIPEWLLPFRYSFREELFVLFFRRHQARPSTAAAAAWWAPPMPL